MRCSPIPVEVDCMKSSTGLIEKTFVKANLTCALPIEVPLLISSHKGIWLVPHNLALHLEMNIRQLPTVLQSFDFYVSSFLDFVVLSLLLT